MDVGAILAGAARSWWRHWPVLFALYLAGVGARQWLLHLGVIASKTDATLGFAVFLTGPLALMMCLVLMLIVLQNSRSGAETGDGVRPRARISDVLRRLTSVLIPFLGVYVSLGWLRGDQIEYVNQVFVAEVLSNPAIFTDPDSVNVMARLPFVARTATIVLLVVVVVLRWVVPRWRRSRAWLIVALVSAYAEVLWLSMLGRQFSPHGEWWKDRQIIVWITTGWARLADLAGPAHGLVSWIGTQFGDADAVLLAPIAWLVLALVLSRREIDPSVEIEQDDAPPHWVSALRPRPLGWLGNGIFTDLRNRFGPLATAIGVMVRGGFVPTALLCVLVAALSAGNRLLWEAERLIIGPQELAARWFPLSYWLGPLDDAIMVVGITCVVAATADRLRGRVRLQRARSRQVSQAA